MSDYEIKGTIPGLFPVDMSGIENVPTRGVDLGVDPENYYELRVKALDIMHSGRRQTSFGEWDVTRLDLPDGTVGARYLMTKGTDSSIVDITYNDHTSAIHIDHEHIIDSMVRPSVRKRVLALEKNTAVERGWEILLRQSLGHTAIESVMPVAPASVRAWNLNLESLAEDRGRPKSKRRFWQRKTA